uniref:VWFA domain-containing protein n=1 Tax=Elaeophora elaphi TaxID=1147741 RepID=A0A0R3RI43_9BILA
MPKRLQKELVAFSVQKYKQDRECFADPKDSMIKEVIGWIKNEWSKWFEANTEKQEKTYVYRKSIKHGEEELDEDDIRIRELLPDFSASNNEDLFEESTSFVSPSTTSIDSESLTEILHLLANEKYIGDCDAHMALAWMMDTASSCGLVDDLMDSKFFVYNLHALNQLDLDKDIRIVDVYRKNSRSELGKCIAAMKPLIKRVNWLKEKWPEMTVLDGILRRTQKILSASMTAPQMQFSALLERLLAEADLWEKVADRNHSLAAELEELRHLLVNWRKMEVMCWDNLLEQVQTDCRAQTLLLSWPLFEALDKEDKGDDEILAMTIEWIQNSTIIDFKARLMTAELLIKFISLTQESVRGDLCQCLKSVLAYFRLFDTVSFLISSDLKIVENKLGIQKEPTENQLRDFVKIMKYNDLNLWSVKASAQKAHKQLFCLLKQFRLSGSDLVAPLFDEMPPMLATIDGHATKATFATDRIILCNDFYAKRCVELTLEIVAYFTDGMHLEDIRGLTEFVKCCNDLIRKEVHYEGDDSEKEKQQGRALSQRQKAIARLFKDSATCGLSSRKGLAVNAEQLTANVVAGMPVDDTMLTKFIRYGGISRNIVLKNFHKPNAQIGTKTMSQLKGLTEFILNELYLYHQTVTTMRESLKKMNTARKMLLNHLENTKDAKQPCSHGQQWLHCLQKSKYLTLKFISFLEFIRTKLENAPECNSDFEGNAALKFSGIQETSFSQLHKQHQEYILASDAMKKTQNAAARILENIKCSLLHAIDCGSIAIWKSSDISHTVNIVKSECTDINSQLSLISCIMVEEAKEALEILHEVLGTLTPASVREAMEDITWEKTQALLIALQNTYKQAMSIDLDNPRFMDILSQLINLLQNSNFEKLTNEIWNLCAQLSEGRGSMEYDRLEQVTSISSTLCEVLSFILEVVENSAIELAKYYVHFQGMAAALLERGYVNPIPKPQKDNSEKDGGELQSCDDDIAGLGDAKGEKDVGDDIDETGQVEGLKNDKENGNDELDKNRNDSTPLDMDDDFGGCLENIDCDQRGDDDESDENDTEPETNEMGNVNESEEDKLDPDLWDQSDDNEKELADGSEGANKETDNMAADNNEQDPKNDKNDKDAFDGDDDSKDNKDYSDDGHVENVDEHESLDKNVDDEDPVQTDECRNDSNDGEKESEDDDIEHLMNDKLNEDDDQSNSDVGEETKAEMTEKDAEETQENFENEANDVTMEELNEDNNEVFKGGAGGMERGAVEDILNKDAVSIPNIVNDNDENMKETDSIAKIQGKGKNDCKETGDDDIGNEKVENMGKNDRKSEQEKKLADDITGTAIHETLPSEGEQKDEEGSEFGHVDGNNSSLREQMVIDKGSVEEARNSKENRDQLRNLESTSVEQNDDEMMEGGGTEDKEEVNEDDLTGTNIWGSSYQNSIIHSTTDFYRLVEQSVSTITSLDSEEIDSSNTDAEDQWSRISASVSILAAELSENLRMIIEPTVASRFEGDYRTGKRLNMRRLIAYIASGYRKDKIWLRRTKKAQHNYQILIAVDDSSSMHDNQIKLKACQSVAMIESGLRRLEIGQLAICKFGGSVKMISYFGNYGGSDLGGKLINELNFGQDRTDLVNLLKCSKKIFEQARGRERNDQMLIIVSDGRGVLADGAEVVKKAVAELHADQVTVLFVAIDNGEKSIVDMKVAEFTADGNVNLIPYLQKFPFPFYVVVGHVAMLPATIGDAVRQWFELTARDS